MHSAKFETLTAPLHHGGRLRAAAAEYGIPLGQWLDLSTGIYPSGWPVPALPAHIWARLPEEGDGLEAAARDYYGCRSLLPVAGSQAAIQALPRLRGGSRVRVLAPSYAEHAHAWQRAGHAVAAVAAADIEACIDHTEVLVLVHPNNPSGASFTLPQLLDWHARLAIRGGWLLVDEAYMDATPAASLCPHSATPGLIVLRSLGKFFGLAGARVGFVCAEPLLLARLHAELGPWTVSTAARWLAQQALSDRAWQAATRAHLLAESARLQALLTQYGLEPDGGCALFQWRVDARAAMLHTELARRGILTRLFDAPAALRLGLPGGATQWARLEQALHELAHAHGIEARR